jgi:pimeloyl-ACP methyl ester carboxylesterase
MEEKLLPTPRGAIHYWVSRGGDPQAPGLVFCHGLMADHSMWEPQVKAFAEQRTLIAWDAPLHGVSRPYRDFDYRRAGEDLLAILDAEALARAVFVGADLGALAAQAAAALRPACAAGLVGVGALPLGAELYAYGDLFRLRHLGAALSCLPEHLLRAAVVRRTCASESSSRRMTAMLQGTDRAARRAQLDAWCGAAAVWEKEAAPVCPVRLLLGQYDRVSRLRAYNVDWARRRGWPLDIVPQAGHFAGWDAPATVSRGIETMLRAAEQGIWEGTKPWIG